MIENYAFNSFYLPMNTFSVGEPINEYSLKIGVKWDYFP